MPHLFPLLAELRLLLYSHVTHAGGLSTSTKSLRANLLLSLSVAATGIAAPIALSFVLRLLVDASPLQAFAAGAALCSTSLGTAFTVLRTSGLSSTRLGFVLASAAMMDDVVGLVMVQIVSNLGSGDVNAVTVVRPVLVSLAYATVVPLFCHFLVRPATVSLNALCMKHPGSRIDRFLRARATAFTIHTGWLFCLVATGTMAGTSSLLTAYIAGVTISWWDSEVPHVLPREKSSQSRTKHPPRQLGSLTGVTETPSARGDLISTASQVEPLADLNSGLRIYHECYSKAVEHVLKPFFFVGTATFDQRQPANQICTYAM